MKTKLLASFSSFISKKLLKIVRLPLIRQARLVSLCVTLLFLIAMQCEEPELTPLEMLPEESATGKGSFGCLINGEAFVVKSSSRATAQKLEDSYYIRAFSNDEPLKYSLALVVQKTIEQNKSYPLTMFPVNYPQTIGNVIGCEYEPELTFEGSVFISRIDSINRIISGRFEYSTALPGCDTLRMTDGRFDVKIY